MHDWHPHRSRDRPLTSTLRPATADALGSLKQERAEAARTKLVALGVDAGRLFLTQGGERAKKEAGARVYFSLK